MCSTPTRSVTMIDSMKAYTPEERKILTNLSSVPFKYDPCRLDQLPQRAIYDQSQRLLAYTMLYVNKDANITLKLCQP